MKLSECMLVGAQKKPQAKKYYFNFNKESGEVISTCAIGAAADGAGYDFQKAHDIQIFLFEKFPELFEEDDWESYSSLFDEITLRNDSGESRESIAADLASRGL